MKGRQSSSGRKGRGSRESSCATSGSPLLFTHRSLRRTFGRQAPCLQPPCSGGRFAPEARRPPSSTAGGRPAGCLGLTRRSLWRQRPKRGPRSFGASPYDFDAVERDARSTPPAQRGPCREARLWREPLRALPTSPRGTRRATYRRPRRRCAPYPAPARSSSPRPPSIGTPGTAGGAGGGGGGPGPSEDAAGSSETSRGLAHTGVCCARAPGAAAGARERGEQGEREGGRGEGAGERHAWRDGVGGAEKGEKGPLSGRR